ncbi:MAG: radical SAM protein [Patescibacteria group bacterium]|nr:radical SAM protein [Patescibacteria group bacterium]
MKRKIVVKDKVASCYFRSSTKSPYRKALLQITEKCNLHCSHCFVSSDSRGGSMFLKEMHEIVIPKLKQCHVISATLTGGEPFMHEDIMEIVQLLRAADISVSICTNGTVAKSFKHDYSLFLTINKFLK